MKKLRKVVAESGVGTVATAVLLFWSLEAAVKFIWQGGAELLVKLVDFVATAIAITGMPYIPDSLDIASHVFLFTVGWHFMMSLGCYVAAHLLSVAVFGESPIANLQTVGTRLRIDNA